MSEYKNYGTKHSVNFLEKNKFSRIWILVGEELKTYSLHTWKECRFGQRHGLQSLTLTSYFLKNIYRKVMYLYFYEYFFKINLFIWFLYFETQRLKSYSWFIFPMLTQTLSKMTFFRVWREYVQAHHKFRIRKRAECLTTKFSYQWWLIYTLNDITTHEFLIFLYSFDYQWWRGAT